MKREHPTVIVATACCGYIGAHPPTSLDYQIHHKAFHLSRWPRTDAATLQSLDALIAKYTPHTELQS